MKLADYIPMKEYTIEINVLGLRQLESFGLGILNFGGNLFKHPLHEKLVALTA
jgi:hypothetical protein